MCLGDDDDGDLGDLDVERLSDDDMEQDMDGGNSSKSKASTVLGGSTLNLNGDPKEARKGKGKAKAGSPAKVKKTHLKKAGGAPTKDKTTGKKQCKGCMRQLGFDEFPPGSAYCHPDKVATQNLANAAKVQGEEKKDWWADVLTKPNKLKRVLAMYHKRHPPPAKGKRKAPVLMEFMETYRQEEQLLMDKVLEMMNEAHFVHFMGKPRNGRMDPKKAAEKFWLEYNSGDHITDEKGDVSVDLKCRVAWKVHDYVTRRDLEATGRQVLSKDLCVNNVSPEAVKAAKHKLDNTGLNPEDDGRSERANIWVRSNTGSSSAMGSVARAVASIGDLNDYASDDDKVAAANVDGNDDDDGDDDDDDDDDDGDEEGGGEDTASKRSVPSSHDGTPSKSEKRKKAWFNRDEVLTSELSKHANWMDSSRNNYKAFVDLCGATFNKVTEEIADVVINESPLMGNRVTGARLILGLGSTPSDLTEREDDNKGITHMGAGLVEGVAPAKPTEEEPPAVAGETKEKTDDAVDVEPGRMRAKKK